MRASYNVRHSFYAVILNGSAAGLAFGVQYLIIQCFGLADYGDYSFVNSGLIILSTVSNFGLPILSLRTFARSETDGNTDLYKIIGFCLISSAITIPIFLVVYHFFFALSIGIFIPVSLFFILKNLLTIFGVVLQAQGKTVQARSLIPIGPSLLVLAALSGLWLVNSSENLSDESLWVILAFSYACLLGIYSFRHNWSMYLRTAGDVFRTLTWGFRNGKYFFLTNASAIAQQRLPVVFCGIFLVNEATGALNLVIQIATIALLVITASNQVLAPRMSKYFQERSAAKFYQVIKLSLLLGTVTSGTFFIGVLCFGKDVLTFISQDIDTVAYHALIVLALGQFLKSLTGPIGFALCMSKYEGLVARIDLQNTLVFVLLLMWITPVYGMFGIACATAGVNLFRNIRLSVISAKKSSFHTSVFVFVKQPRLIE